MTLAGIPLDFILFALTLLGVALFHHQTLYVALTGLAVITLYKLGFGDFSGVTGVAGLAGLLSHEWVTLANLLGLLLGFALLADHFERSGVPGLLPRFLPDDWKGGFCLLLIVFVLSSFLDNIAAAMIGGTMASVLYNKRVHIGFLAAHRRGEQRRGLRKRGRRHHHHDDVDRRRARDPGVRRLCGSRHGNAHLRSVRRAPAACAAAHHERQPRRNPLRGAAPGRSSPLILLSAIGANVFFNLHDPAVLSRWPVIGMAVWVAIVVLAPWRRPTWSLLPEALRGSIFLLSLVLCAAMMPVQHLPAPSWQSAFGLGFVSAVFDNIPLTALALRQGGYDWGFLAYAVGFGGSMIWFGSSAGVALSNMYPQARSVGAWLKGGWHVTVGYVVGFFVLLAVLGWHPDPAQWARQR